MSDKAKKQNFNNRDENLTEEELKRLQDNLDRLDQFITEGGMVSGYIFRIENARSIPLPIPHSYLWRRIKISRVSFQANRNDVVQIIEPRNGSESEILLAVQLLDKTSFKKKTERIGFGDQLVWVTTRKLDDETVSVIIVSKHRKMPKTVALIALSLMSLPPIIAGLFSKLGESLRPLWEKIPQAVRKAALTGAASIVICVGYWLYQIMPRPITNVARKQELPMAKPTNNSTTLAGSPANQKTASGQEKVISISQSGKNKWQPSSENNPKGASKSSMTLPDENSPIYIKADDELLQSEAYDLAGEIGLRPTSAANALQRIEITLEGYKGDPDVKLLRVSLWAANEPIDIPPASVSISSSELKDRNSVRDKLKPMIARLKEHIRDDKSSVSNGE